MIGERLWNKIKNFAKKHRVALGGIVLSAVLLFVLAWTGYNLHHSVKNTCEYKIIHDEYVEKQALYPENQETGLLQILPDPQGETLYGLRLMFATDNRVDHGMFSVKLMQESTVAAQAENDMTMLLDGAFIDVIFDAPTVLEKGKEYSVQIAFYPENAADRAGLVYGEGEMSDPRMMLYEADESARPGKTAALQYITNYTGTGFGLHFFAPVAFIAFVIVMLGWWLTYVKKSSAHVVFAVLAAGLGLVWTIVTPPLAGPDEYAHVAAAYQAVNRMTGIPAATEEGMLMRACDAPYMLDHSGEIGPIAYKNMADNLASFGNDGALNTLAKIRPPVSVQPGQYLGQILGISAARLLGLGFYPMLLLGRIFNMAFFVVLTAAAIKITPVGKNIFFAAGLLPSCLALAGSLSADPAVVGFAFLFTALCLSGRYGNRPLKKGEEMLLIVLAVLLAPAKMIYMPLIFLCLMIPDRCLGNGKKGRRIKTAVIGLGLLSWLIANGGTAFYMLRGLDTERLGLAVCILPFVVLGFWLCLRKWGQKPIFRKIIKNGVMIIVLIALGIVIWVLGNSGVELTPEEYAESIQPNGESYYLFTVSYVICHIPQTIKLLINTFSQGLPTYLQGLVGALPGEPIVHGLELNWVLTLALTIVLLSACLRMYDEKARLDSRNTAGFWVVCLIVTGLIVLAAINWTPINSVIAFGIQGRYLLPILPMMLLLAGDNRVFALKKNADQGIRLASGILSTMAIMESLVLFAAG